MPKNLEIYKVKDKAETYYTKKDIIFDLPFRLLIVGKSQLSGKSNIVINLLLRDEFYNKDFDGEDIYIVSPSMSTDAKLKKLIEVKEIPEENLFHTYDEDVLDEFYKIQQEEYEEAVANGEKPKNKLILFDDMSYNGDLKSKTHGVVNRIFSNGRHINLSIITTAQKYTDLLTAARENASGGIFFNCSNKQLKLIEEDHNMLDSKKNFHNMFRNALQGAHNFLVVNYSNLKEMGLPGLYLDKNFDSLIK
jgi:hypothetical protein